jgi:hypothetical protein
MNKNVLFALLGIGVFAVLLIVIWGRGRDEGGPAFEPAPPPAGEQSKAPEEGTKKPPMLPPVPGEGEKQPPPPDQPGPGEQADPPGEGETKKPAEGEGEVKNPDPPGEVKVETPKAEPGEKTRITAETDAVDEEAKKAAAGHLEAPMLLEGEEKAEVEEKKYPDSYVTEKVMSLYRVAEIVYGDATKWQLLFEANKAMLEDPEKVDAGVRLTVPDPDSPAGKPEKKKKTSLSEGLF